MTNCRFWGLLSCILLLSFWGQGQRNYASNSVLSSGNWYKIAIHQPGVYKMDLSFLNSLGISGGNIPSSSIRLFGNGGAMLSEANAGPWIDDLQENAIMVVDGGDGTINGTDYILFYAEGPNKWIKDSANLRFKHQKHLYSDRSFYFISIGGLGKRILDALPVPGPSQAVNTYSAREWHELDSVNFLASGKEWFGEEFANMPGKTTSRNFPISIPALVPNASLSIVTNCVARSVGAPSRFDVKLNDQPLGQLLINPVGGGLYDLFAQQASAVLNSTVTSTSSTINYNFIPGSFNAQGWLNWFEIFSRASLEMNGNNQLLFRDWASVGNGNKAEFIISNSNSSTQVWDVTNPFMPERMPVVLNGSELRFINSAERLREYASFNTSGLLTPVAIGKINNQNLHQPVAADYLLVVYSPFLAQAQRLAAFHQQRNGLRTMVVSTEQVYNEFASGAPDPVAIRDYAKMFHDRYRTVPSDQPKYLLLFGDASYDFKQRINNNTNYVPAWENENSLDPLSTYASDDFFGFLDDNEDINSGLLINYLDLGIGRVPSKNPDEAKNFVDKIITYSGQASLGPWRNNLTLIADDEDFNLHLQDAEIFSSTINTVGPVFNQHKIYLDAYRQESGSGGSRYPQANLAIDNMIYNGTLIWNYNGHGGAHRLAEETILDQEIVNRWSNPDRLPLFITATCDFAPYDNPVINSLGENLLTRPKTGGIALMTTTRVVFAFSNRIMNDNYLRIALEPRADGKYKSLGEAVKEAKNFTYQTSGDVTNNRKFTLLGDPALTLGFPTFKVKATRVNGIPVSQPDTLSATEKIEIEGEVTDLQGNLLSNFDGSVFPVVFDKPQVVQTLGNDPTSPPTSFQSQTNALFKGKASVSGGKFTFSFKVPKDINYQFGNGKLSLYAENGSTDANGAFTGFIVGGAGTNTDMDNEGPEIKPYLNDESFVNGGISNENPILIVKLADSSGINTAGTGIGHDIVATLDNDNNRFFILNDFYQSDLDSYQSGTVRFQLPELEPGPHTIKIKAWDILNNSNEKVIEFTIVKDEELTLAHVLNYPNPFSTKTHFWFEHNKPGQELQVRLQIFTVTGRIIKMIQKTINTEGNRSMELEWNGRDEYGDKVGRGVYLYKLSVTATGGQRKEKIEKLVVF